MRQGWHGESGRHSKAAKLGWRRKLRAGGQKTRFVKHLFKRGAKKIYEPAIQAGKEVGHEWKEAAKETTPGKIAHRVHRWGSEEFEKFKAEEEGREYISPATRARMEAEEYSYTHPHRKRPIV
jgi:dissimilatory sulfite reductase (desulfoviridin) alpha/beta subunit